MKRILPILLCVCLAVSACTNRTENPEQPTPAPEAPPAPTEVSKDTTPREGGNLRLAMRTPLTLNPLLNEDATVDRVLKLVFEPLTVLDGQLKPAGHLAGINFASDYASVNLTLRDDAIWSDGTPVSSDDILFTIDFIRKAPEASIYKHSIDNIAAAERIDSKTVKITFVEIFGGSGYLFNFPVIPQHYYKNENNPVSEKNMAPLGNGLFMFETYTPTQNMTLVQSPYTFRKRTYIESAEILFMADAETELYAFDQGLIDVISLELTEWSRHHSVKQTHYGEFSAMYYDFVGFNFKNAIFQNRLFREAIAHSTNWDELISNVYLTHAARTLSPINPASWVYDKTLAAYTYDSEAATALLERVRNGETGEAQESEAQDAVPEEINDADDNATDSEAIPDSDTTDTAMETEVPAPEPAELTPLRILVNEENDERVKIARTLADNLTNLGLEITVEAVPFEQFSQKLSAGDYDMFVGGYNLSLIPDISFAFHSGRIAEGSNLLAYSDPILDRFLNTAFSASTENAYIKALANVQQRIAEELPVISLAYRKSAVITDTRVYGEIKPSPDNIFANINEWYIVE